MPAYEIVGYSCLALAVLAVVDGLATYKKPGAGGSLSDVARREDGTYAQLGDDPPPGPGEQSRMEGHRRHGRSAAI